MRITTACAAAFMICLAGLPVHAADVPLLEEGYETDLALKIPVHGANQPYTAHEIGVTTERAHTGTHCVKKDVT
jgi:hypothetical protein